MLAEPGVLNQQDISGILSLFCCSSSSLLLPTAFQIK